MIARLKFARHNCDAGDLDTAPEFYGRIIIVGIGETVLVDPVNFDRAVAAARISKLLTTADPAVAWDKTRFDELGMTKLS